MLSYQSGMIGLPLRLLAREVYDRVLARHFGKAHPADVAEITGEEKIVRNARFSFAQPRPCRLAARWILSR